MDKTRSPHVNLTINLTLGKGDDTVSTEYNRLYGDFIILYTENWNRNHNIRSGHKSSDSVNYL